MPFVPWLHGRKIQIIRFYVPRFHCRAETHQRVLENKIYSNYFETCAGFGGRGGGEEVFT